MFTLYETLFLLAIDDEDGDFAESTASDLEPALAGAVLIDLLLLNRVKITEGRVAILDHSSTDNRILDKAMFAVEEAGRARRIKYWINTLIFDNLPGDVAQALIDKQALARKKKKLHLVVPFGEGNVGSSAKFVLKNRLREIVLGGLPGDVPELIQLLFLNSCNLLTLVFTRGERKAANKVIMALLEENELLSPLKQPLSDVISAASRLTI